MGAYADNLKRKREQDAINNALTGTTDNNQTDTIAEVLNLFKPNEQEKVPIVETIKSIVDEKIAAAIGAEGAITTWADGRFAAKEETSDN